MKSINIFKNIFQPHVNTEFHTKSRTYIQGNAAQQAVVSIQLAYTHQMRFWSLQAIFAHYSPWSGRKPKAELSSTLTPAVQDGKAISTTFKTFDNASFQNYVYTMHHFKLINF